jgi:hypothetical protein
MPDVQTFRILANPQIPLEAQLLPCRNGMGHSGMKHFTLAEMEWHILFRPEWNEAFHSGQKGKTHFISMFTLMAQ